MTPVDTTADADESSGEVDDVAMPTPERAVRRGASEDWVATIVGLALMGLALIGVITKAMVP